VCDQIFPLGRSSPPLSELVSQEWNFRLLVSFSLESSFLKIERSSLLYRTWLFSFIGPSYLPVQTSQEEGILVPASLLRSILFRPPYPERESGIFHFLYVFRQPLSFWRGYPLLAPSIRVFSSPFAFLEGFLSPLLFVLVARVPFSFLRACVLFPPPTPVRFPSPPADKRERLLLFLGEHFPLEVLFLFLCKTNSF